MKHAAGRAYSRQRIGLPNGYIFSHDKVDTSATSEDHQCRVQRRIASSDDGDSLLFVVSELGQLVMNVFGIEFVEHRKPAGIVQEPAGNDDFAAKVGALVGHHAFQLVFSLDLVCILDADQFFGETEL